MLFRGPEQDILPLCAKQSLATLTYMSLEQGLLTGRFGMEHRLAADEYRNALPWFKPANRVRGLQMLDGWRDPQPGKRRADWPG